MKAHFSSKGETLVLGTCDISFIKLYFIVCLNKFQSETGEKSRR